MVCVEPRGVAKRRRDEDSSPWELATLKREASRLPCCASALYLLLYSGRYPVGKSEKAGSARKKVVSTSVMSTSVYSWSGCGFPILSGPETAAAPET